MIPALSAETLARRDNAAFDLLVPVRRELYNFDPDAIASACGITTSTILRFRSGRTAWPRPRTLFAILSAMGYQLVLVQGRPQ